MPTFETTARFARDFKKLLPEERARFQETIRDKFVPDVTSGRFRPGLRGKQVRGFRFPPAYVPSWK
ncbi:hypothetical protein [Streptomyces laurentii]|uniref:hypothetical protein n=1 Tax=Streptomyces laurentii TaxID=39478 RepID=UPI00368B8A49